MTKTEHKLSDRMTNREYKLSDLMTYKTYTVRLDDKYRT